MSRRLAEVARDVGVSGATVSRVLDHEPGVSEQILLAVPTALDVMGHERPTELRADRGRLIGLVVRGSTGPAPAAGRPRSP